MCLGLHGSNLLAEGLRDQRRSEKKSSIHDGVLDCLLRVTKVSRLMAFESSREPRFIFIEIDKRGEKRADTFHTEGKRAERSEDGFLDPSSAIYLRWRVRYL